MSAQPVPLSAAPSSVTGEVRDHIALRGAASPLCKEVSASRYRGMVAARKSSVSLISSSPSVLDASSNQIDLEYHSGRGGCQAARVPEHHPAWRCARARLRGGVPAVLDEGI